MKSFIPKVEGRRDDISNHHFLASKEADDLASKAKTSSGSFFGEEEKDEARTVGGFNTWRVNFWKKIMMSYPHGC